MASGFAWPSSSGVTVYGAKIVRAGRLSSSWPIDTQVSVTTTSAPVTASTGSA